MAKLMVHSYIKMSDVLGWFVPICIFCAFLNFSMGSNDESMGSAYGAKSIPLMPALILGAITEMAGSVLFGRMVSTTIQGKLFSLSEFGTDTDDVMKVVLASVIGAAVWLVGSSLLGLPTSSTHSIIGAVCFAAMAARGGDIIEWAEIGKIVASWFLSPLLGSIAVWIIYGALHISLLRNRDKAYERTKRWIPLIFFICNTTLGLFVALKGIQLPLTIPRWQPALAVVCISAFFSIIIALFGVPYVARRIDSGADTRVFVGTYTDPRAEKLFSYIEIFSASLFSFARGSNDASHGTGPFALGIAIYLDGKEALTGDPREVDVWVMAIGGVCMALGLIFLGKKVVKTVGDSLTEITPSSGVMTELATAIVVLGFSALALPISSTHTMVGTIYGMSKFRKHVIERWFVEPEGKETKEMVEPKRTGKTRREDVDNSEEENSDSSKSKGSNSQRIINEEPADNGNEEQGPPLTGFRGFMKRHKTSIKIFSAWVITIPLSGAIAAMFYAMFDA